MNNAPDSQPATVIEKGTEREEEKKRKKKMVEVYELCLKCQRKVNG